MTDVNRIARVCEKHWHLAPGSVLSSTRGTPSAALARRVAMYIRWTMWGSKTNWSALGREFNRDRSTCREAVKRVTKEMDEGLGTHLRALRAALR